MDKYNCGDVNIEIALAILIRNGKNGYYSKLNTFYSKEVTDRDIEMAKEIFEKKKNTAFIHIVAGVIIKVDFSDYPIIDLREYERYNNCEEIDKMFKEKQRS